MPRSNLSALDRLIAAIGALAILAGGWVSGWWWCTQGYADLKTEMGIMKSMLADTRERVIRIEDRELGKKVALNRGRDSDGIE